jgi:GTP-binding protein HflX
MKEITEPKERALLVKLRTPGESRQEAGESIEELGRLVESAGGEVVGRLIQLRKVPDPAFYIGRGKAEEVKAAAAESGADLVVFDDDLSPTQDKNLEKLIDTRVLDRSELILDIFALRARTAQAMLQVELAQLEYLLPRLTRMWEHLSRIRGGIGLRGPGETQLEVDRRVIRKRIGHLRDRMEIVRRRRRRQRGRRAGEYNIALVGYTNAGKSTLFNRLTGSRIATGDRLFETLDARTRPLRAESGRQVLITDTVGFIRKLPHHLVASFRATLEEVVEARLLLHVVDVSTPGVVERIEVVDRVLEDLGAGATPVIHVFNKIDCGDPADHAAFRETYPGCVFTSCRDGKGIDGLKAAVLREVRRDALLLEYTIPLLDARTLARLYDAGEVLERSMAHGRMTVRVRMERETRDRLRKAGIRGVRVG